jgi:hypothetical protein
LISILTNLNRIRLLTHNPDAIFLLIQAVWDFRVVFHQYIAYCGFALIVSKMLILGTEDWEILDFRFWILDLISPYSSAPLLPCSLTPLLLETRFIATCYKVFQKGGSLTEIGERTTPNSGEEQYVYI